MNTIWKFPLGLTDAQNVRMPDAAQILSVDFQGDTLCLWAIVNDVYDTSHRTFLIVGTGHPLPELHTIRYIGTAQKRPFVWHVFERIQ